MKKLFRRCSAGAAALIMCISASAVSAAETVKGDTNGDGAVTSADLGIMKDYLLAGKDIPAAGKANADMNGDSSVNIIDFILLKQLFAEGGEPDTPAASNIIHLQGDKIAADGEGITVDGTKVTVSRGGEYTVEGSMTTDAQIIIKTAADDTEAVELTLDSVTMTNTLDAACIMVENADKTKISFTGTNVLTSKFDEVSASSAAIYAKDDITFTRKSAGTLEINTNACMGIYCNNDIKFNGGKIKIKTDADGSEKVKADAVKAKGDVEVAGGDISINAAGDGLKSSKSAVLISDGKLSVKAGKDAIQGETAVTFSGGDTVASGDRGIAGETIDLTITGGRVFATGTEGLVVNEIHIPDSIVFAYFAEQHAKSEILTVGGIDFTANKKYQNALIYDPSFDENKPKTVLVDGKEYDFRKASESSSGQLSDGLVILGGFIGNDK